MRKDMEGRWTRERYRAEQEKLFAIMHDKEAVPGKPILRHELKEEARRVIVDAGLIDNLLEYMTDTIMTNGQRFKRRYNSERVLEFWLEDADQKLLPEEEDGGILKEMLKGKVETSQTECTVEQTNLSVIKMLSCNILDRVEKLETLQRTFFQEMESNHRADMKQWEDKAKVTEGLERVQEELKSLLKSIDKSTVTAMKEVAASPEESFTEALIAGSSTQNSNDKEDTTEGVELSS